MKKSTLHGSWEAVWPNLVDAVNSQIFLENEYSQIIGLALTLGGEGFEDLAEADIVELMADGELNENELIEMAHAINENEGDVDKHEPNAFTAKIVREGLDIGTKLGNYFFYDFTEISTIV